MKRVRFFLIYIIVLLICLSQSGCHPDENIAPANNGKDTLSAKKLEINEFIWSGLHTYYLWVDSVPNLSYNKFPLESDWVSFLNGYPDHEKLFYDLLYNYTVVDKWSWIVDDYVALENQFQGITKSMGYNFRLVRFNNSDDIFGYVRYVVQGSPADLAGMKRGDIFIQVNDQQLTILNYQSLLLDNESYTLSFATISNSTVTPNNRQVSLTAMEVHENPIYLDTVLHVSGIKIGYLVYNGFMSDYDIQLNGVFQHLKDQGIQKLILDLRYNPGGSVQTAMYLASMIYSTDTNKIFLKSQYNKGLQDYLSSTYGNDFFSEKFADKIEKTDLTPETPINTLNLDKVYVITTDNTASASELIINGLKPYISVITVGTNTYGKYVGSMTIKDWDQDGNVNPNHTWALQPIVLKIANSVGTTDYFDGLAPTINAEEDIANLLPFGVLNETLLKATLDYIQGISRKKSVEFNMNAIYRNVADSKDLIPHGKEMYFNKKMNKLLIKHIIDTL
jgi:C-terminal processing protease CtpA/Prc